MIKGYSMDLGRLVSALACVNKIRWHSREIASIFECDAWAVWRLDRLAEDAKLLLIRHEEIKTEVASEIKQTLKLKSHAGNLTPVHIDGHAFTTWTEGAWVLIDCMTISLRMSIAIDMPFTNKQKYYGAWLALALSIAMEPFDESAIMAGVRLEQESIPRYTIPLYKSKLIKMYDISPSTFQRRLKSGEIPHIDETKRTVRLSIEEYNRLKGE